MNAMLFIVGLGCVPLFAVSAFAAGPSVDSTAILQANFIYELASDRSRLIQISVVFVSVGCALIWWYK